MTMTLAATSTERQISATSGTSTSPRSVSTTRQLRSSDPSTDLTVPIFSSPDVLKLVMSHTPLKRLPEVDDIAAAILYLCSPAARCITGIVLPVDSGYLAR